MKRFYGDTREEAYKLAEEYMKTVDYVRQPYIESDYRTIDGQHCIVVRERGCD